MCVAHLIWRAWSSPCARPCVRVACAEENEDVSWVTAADWTRSRSRLWPPFFFFFFLCMFLNCVLVSGARRRVTAGWARRALRKIPNSCGFRFTSNPFLEATEICLQDEIILSLSAPVYVHLRHVSVFQKKKSCNKLICIQDKTGYLSPLARFFLLLKTNKRSQD